MSAGSRGKVLVAFYEVQGSVPFFRGKVLSAFFRGKVVLPGGNMGKVRGTWAR
jgi:hypothetical protein